MTGGRGRRHKQLLDDLKEKRGCLKLKEEVLDHTVWGTGFGKMKGRGKDINDGRTRKKT